MSNVTIMAQQIALCNLALPTFFRKRRTTGDSKILTIGIGVVKFQQLPRPALNALTTELLNTCFTSCMVATKHVCFHILTI